MDGWWWWTCWCVVVGEGTVDIYLWGGDRQAEEEEEHARASISASGKLLCHSYLRRARVAAGDRRKKVVELKLSRIVIMRTRL